jgi:hypothetical protein
MDDDDEEKEEKWIRQVFSVVNETSEPGSTYLIL